MMLTPFFKVVDGTSYCSDTPDSLVQVLERARLSRVRVRVTYGEGDSHDGYVSRTTGSVKVPILVHNSRSLAWRAHHGALRARGARGRRQGAPLEAGLNGSLLSPVG